MSALQNEAVTGRRPLGVMAALPQELGNLIEVMRAESGVRTITHGSRDYHLGTVHGAPCVVTLARIGKVAAAATVSALIHAFEVDAVVFTGVAGGVGREVRIGDVVVADTLMQHDLDASPLFPRFEVPLLGIARFAAGSVAGRCNSRRPLSGSSRKRARHSRNALRLKCRSVHRGPHHQRRSVCRQCGSRRGAARAHCRMRSLSRWKARLSRRSVTSMACRVRSCAPCRTPRMLMRRLRSRRF